MGTMQTWTLCEAISGMAYNSGEWYALEDLRLYLTACGDLGEDAGKPSWIEEGDIMDFLWGILVGLYGRHSGDPRKGVVEDIMDACTFLWDVACSPCKGEPGTKYETRSVWENGAGV